MAIGKKRAIKGKGKASKKQPAPDFNHLFDNANDSNIKGILKKNSAIKKKASHDTLQKKRKRLVKFSLEQKKKQKKVSKTENSDEDIQEHSEEPFGNLIPESHEMDIDDEPVINIRPVLHKNVLEDKIINKMKRIAKQSSQDPIINETPNLPKNDSQDKTIVINKIKKKKIDKKHQSLQDMENLPLTENVSDDKMISHNNNKKKIAKKQSSSQDIKNNLLNLPEMSPSDEFDETECTTLDWLQDLEERNKLNLNNNKDNSNKEFNSHDFMEDFESQIPNLLSNDSGSTDVEQLKGRINDLMSVLSNFKQVKDRIKRSRKFLTSLLVRYLANLYGYNTWLMTHFYELLPLNQLLEFLDWVEKERPITLRVNTLKISPNELLRTFKRKRGAVLKCDKLKILDEINANDVHNNNHMKEKENPQGQITCQDIIIVYEAQFSLGATPEYLTGLYSIQGVASIITSLVLDPKPGQRILDLCAAPGGKSCHIASLMKNQGVLYSNDVNFDRCKSIVANCNRLGILNTIITNYDGREYPKIIKGFDRVLVDAPCMGTGIISKDLSVKGNKDEISLRKTTALQRELLLAAIDCVDAKSGGIIVYSTCSLLIDENELVIDYAMRKRNIKILDTGLSMGEHAFIKYKEHRFHPSMAKCRRFYPHIHNTDGFFIAKLQKLYTKPETINVDGSNNTVKKDVNDVVSNKNSKNSKKNKKLTKNKINKSKVLEAQSAKFSSQSKNNLNRASQQKLRNKKRKKFGNKQNSDKDLSEE